MTRPDTPETRTDIPADELDDTQLDEAAGGRGRVPPPTEEQEPTEYDRTLDRLRETDPIRRPSEDGGEAIPITLP